MSAQVHVGDIDTEIVLDCVAVVTGLTTAKIKYRKPDGTTGEWDAEIEGTTQIKYVTAKDDLDVPGVWILQAYVEFPAWSGHGAEAAMVVYSTL